MIRESSTLLSLLFLCSASCVPSGSSRDDPDDHGAGPEPAVPLSNVIEISPTVRRNLGITFAPVEVRHVAQTIRVPGSFELQPLARREYRMALPGRVELLVDQYDRVESGQTLFRYQSPSWPELLHEIILGEQASVTALAEIEVARAKLDEARRKLELVRERIEALARAEFKKADLETEAAALEASLPRLAAELDLAQTTHENAGRTREHALHRAATAAGMSEEELEAEVQVGDEYVPVYTTIDWIEVHAVRAGVVELLGVTDGAFAEAPTNVLSVVDPEQVRFRALALQADMPARPQAAGARIVPPPAPGVPAAGGVDARMTIGLEAHPRERTLTLLATPQQRAPWIRPGVSAFLEVVVDSTDEPALAVPRSAVVLDGLHHVLFRRNPSDPNEAIRIEADMGTDDGQWVVIQSGVVRGDEVVLDGVYELKLATQQRGGTPAGSHVHADGSVHGDH